MTVWEVPKLTHAFRVGGMMGMVNYLEYEKVCHLAR
jgi:hypothetical protein